MDFIKIAGFALAALALLTLLRQYNPSYAVPAGIACCAVLLAAALGAITPLLETAERFAAYADWDALGSVLKAAAIAIMAQLTQDLCRDAGHSALAGRVELAGRVAMLLAALPLFASLADTLTELLR